MQYPKASERVRADGSDIWKNDCHGEKVSFLQRSSPLSQAIMPYMAAVQTDQTNEHSLLPVSQQEPGGFWCFDGMFLCFSLLIFYK